jgi:hypothetical protein
MYLPLQESVNTAFIDASGWLIGLGGLFLTAAWLHYLYR